jgi:outer membrane receptor protein involved in Fe transport
LVLAAITLSLAAVAFAQSDGTIFGTVKDVTGAVVADATVTVLNPAKGITRKTTTNADGAFVYPQVPPGTYTIHVEKPGFKRVEKTNVVVATGDKLNAGDFLMEVGELAATVQVTADAGQLQIKSESGERSDIVSGSQLRNIGLNGRNVVDLAKLVPGVISGGAASGSGASTVTNITGSFNINGTRSLQHEYTLDGVTNYNLGNNTGALVSVNPDALEEVRILTSNYSAEYGRSGGGFIALTTRSGTNEYHGSGRYFRRHDSLNANTFFNNARGGSAKGFTRPLYRFNFYGWDFGGPAPFIGSKNERKIFFFVNQEYYDQLVPQLAAVNIRVPTAAERDGDFSQSVDGSGNRIVVRDPLTGQPFSNNVITSGRFYGPGQAILKLFPAPNTTAGGNVYNFTSQAPSSYPRRENIVRVDYQIASSTRLSGRWIHNYDDQQFAYGTTTASWNWPLTVTDRKNGPGNVLSFTLTHSFSPTLINEFVFGLGLGGVNISPQGDAATRDVTGIATPLLFPEGNIANLIPSITLGGIANVSVVGNTSVFGPFDQKFFIDQYTDNLTKVWRSHTFKSGVYYQRASNQSNSQTNVEGNIDFSNNGSNPLNTGHPFANALLGIFNTYTQASSKPVASYFYQDLSFYVQDTWKFSPRLTFDLGLRASHYGPYHNILGEGSFFDPALYDRAKATRLYFPVCINGAATCPSGNNRRAVDPSLLRPGFSATAANTLPSNFIGLIVPNSGDLANGLGQTANGYSDSGINNALILWQPRVGFAWDVTGHKTTVVRGGYGIFYDRYQSGITGFGATNSPLVLNPTLFFGRLQDIQSGGGGTLSPSAITGVDRGGEWPTIYNYSIGLQRELGAGIIIDAAYVGSQTRHNPRRRNLNSIAYGTTFSPLAQDPTRFAGGVVPATEPGLPTAHQAAGVKFSGQFALPQDFLRPFPGYSDITYFSFDGNSTYNSLQVSLQRRFSKGLTFGAAYTLSKVTTTVSDDGTFTNIGNTKTYDYALAAFDRTHFFVANYVWNLPNLSNHLGKNWLVRAAFDDWTLSGLWSVASGNPAELGLSVSGQDAGNRIFGAYTNGALAGQQPRFHVTGEAQSSPNGINLSAFSIPAINDVGPYSRMYLRNPGFNSHDMAILKNIRFGESGKRYLQLRAEAFNVFNHTQFSGVNRTTNLATPPPAGSTTPVTGAGIFNDYSRVSITNNTRPAGSTAVLGTFFGEYNAARDPRIIQLAVKFHF